MTQIVNGKKSIAILILMSVLGIYGNSFRYELFFNVDIIFGSIFAILAVRIFGYYGIIAGFIASLYSYILWNHPYAIIIFTAEAAFVAKYSKKLRDIVLTDMVYWLCCGIPIIFITYHLIMGMDIGSVYLVMMKQTVNGVLSALAASCLYDLYRIYTVKKGNGETFISYQHMIFQTILVIIILPMLVYNFVTISTNKSYITNGMLKGLNNASQSADITINEFIRDNLQIIQLIKKLTVNHYPVKDSTDHIVSDFREIESIHKYILNISVLDKDGTYQFCTYRDKVKNHDNIFGGVTHLAEWQGADPYISPLTVMHEEEAPVWVVYLISSLKDADGNISGYVRIAVDFDYIKERLAGITKGSSLYVTLLDNEGKVVFSTSDKIKNGIIWEDRSQYGRMVLLKDNIFEYTPEPKKNVSVMTTWKDSLYIKKTSVSASSGFTIITEMTLTNLVEYMFTSGRRSLTFVFVVILLSIVFSYYVSMGITRQLKRISKRTNDLPAKLLNGGDFDFETSYIKEVADIQNNFKQMVVKLKDMFDELKDQKSDVEQILDSIPLQIVLKDKNDKILMVNSKTTDYLDCGKSELIGKTTSEVYMSNAYYKADKEVMRIGQAIKNVVTEYKPASGKSFTARTSRTPVFNENGEIAYILVLIDDITEELKQNENHERMLALINKQSRMAEIGALMNMIIHQWKQPVNVISLVGQSIKEDLSAGNVNTDDILNDVEILLQNNSFLAQTVSDFTEYYKQSKHKSLFKVGDIISEVQALIAKNFMKARVTFKVYGEENDFEVLNLKNEFKQVCLNILNNAIDSLADKEIDEKAVTVTFEKSGDKGIIKISDNGGGIPPHLLPDKIFEPYMTTKKDGSGIGLYICRNIIQENMGGSIIAVNNDSGAEFIITFDIYEGD